MDMLVEWRLTDSGGLQVWQDSDRARPGTVNLAVDDLPGHRDELAGRGIVTGEIKAVNKGVQLSSVADPEGSQITSIGNFRIRYCICPLARTADSETGRIETLLPRGALSFRLLSARCW